jgi:hypothetical protein
MRPFCKLQLIIRRLIFFRLELLLQLTYFVPTLVAGLSFSTNSYGIFHAPDLSLCFGFLFLQLSYFLPLLIDLILLIFHYEMREPGRVTAFRLSFVLWRYFWLVKVFLGVLASSICWNILWSWSHLIFVAWP